MNFAFGESTLEVLIYYLTFLNKSNCKRSIVQFCIALEQGLLGILETKFIRYIYGEIIL